MTKTQISVRVSPDTMAAIDAAAHAAGTSRGHIIDRWLAAQAATADGTTPYNVNLLVAQARTAAEDGDILGALVMLADAIDILAGTAPE